MPETFGRGSVRASFPRWSVGTILRSWQILNTVPTLRSRRRTPNTPQRTKPHPGGAHVRGGQEWVRRKRECNHVPDNATPPASVISTSTARRNLQRKARCACIRDDLPGSDRSHAPAWECSLGRSSALVRVKGRTGTVFLAVGFQSPPSVSLRAGRSSVADRSA